MGGNFFRGSFQGGRGYIGGRGTYVDQNKEVRKEVNSYRKDDRNFY